ncbi:unnamed protein product [Rotaria magnacalcarata]|uniref:Uncharacterized protein n=1 Tax=Rotaria magnacalcarata TaxID=392030 RepID=A0A816M0H3_9BILA|nr:unnamed protein product [Rotaria magnacalcarata]CAF2149269.1 unnamed protein product [Rotaria magnacalcarata]CAF4148668.1 unnamed protein product [Rotaria magnacalcarata]CAF4156339.1 unnamed protein product [Rotaria magnacalcarata]
MPTIYIIIAVFVLQIYQIDGNVLSSEETIAGSQSKQLSRRKGLTFIKWGHLVPYGIDLVGCRDWTNPNGFNCDPYNGDTDCNEQRTVLCAKTDNSPRPPYLVLGNGAAMPAAFYVGWTLGHISTTLPVAGSSFRNRAAVDAYCAQYFGTGWRVATFHDGKFIRNMNGTTYAGESWTTNASRMEIGGWSYYTFGNVRNDVRSWVHITDQPANCWNN